MNNNAMFSLSYGLFVLSAQENGKDNACIINTAMQVTTTPNRISITVNKGNHTHDMIQRTGKFNISILSEKAPFAVFQRFGFQSGRDASKFEGFEDRVARSENGLYYVTCCANAYISGQVVSSVDLGTHTMFIADVTDCDVLSDVPSVTYSYYHKHIKPAPQVKAENTVKYVCKICGYVYDGDPLPADFVCPICKHGAIDFEKVAAAV